MANNCTNNIGSIPPYSTVVRDYMTGTSNGDCVPVECVEKPMTMTEMFYRQNELIDKNYMMVNDILKKLIGPGPEADLRPDRGTMELTLKSNNDILLEMNTILYKILNVLGD